MCFDVKNKISVYNLLNDVKEHLEQLSFTRDKLCKTLTELGQISDPLKTPFWSRHQTAKITKELEYELYADVKAKLKELSKDKDIIKYKKENL